MFYIDSKIEMVKILIRGADIMIALSLKNISKTYGTDVILKDVSFNVNESEKIGLVGINGAGKTTLFKIICKDIAPDSGEIFTMTGKKIGYLSQNLDLSDDNTVFSEVMRVYENIKDIEIRLRKIEKLLSNIDEGEHEALLKEYGTLQDQYERLNGYGCESFARGMLTGLGIEQKDFDKNIHYLSGGQKTRVALAKLLLSNPDILLLDEPTNHLDLAAISYLESFLKDYSGTVIIISHDRYFLDVITSRTLELTDGIAEDYGGNYSYFISERSSRYEKRTKEYELQQKEIQRLEEIIKKYRSFNREKSIKQAESREKALDRIERIDKPKIDTKSAGISFNTRIKSGNDVLIIDKLSKAFGENTLFNDLSFMIRRGEKVALIGENGKGKTTLFKIICGNLKQDSGLVKLGRNVLVGYYDQEQKNLSPDKNALDEIWDEFPEMTVTQVRTYLGAFLFKGDDVFKPVSKLSGGEKCRLSLLKLMLSNCNLLLLDEPTNHLDMLSREALEDALLEYEGTLFVISHDRYFLKKVIERIYELGNNNLTEYSGGFDYYIAKKNAPEEEIIINTVGKTKTEIKEERKKQRELLERKKQIEIEISGIEKEIAENERLILELEKSLCSEDVYSNPLKCAAVNRNIKELKNSVEELYEKWEKLSFTIED